MVTKANLECPICGTSERTLISSGTGVDCMTQNNNPWVGCPVCKLIVHGTEYSIRSAVEEWNSLDKESAIAYMKLHKDDYK